MRMFGEYLIEKAVIDEAALAAALVAQVRQLPSVAEVIYEKKLLPVKDILRIFKEQNIKKTGFVEAAKSLSLWKDELSTELDRQLSAVRVPLGQILIKSGAASLKAITHALDDFLADRKSPEPASAASVKSNPRVAPGVATVESIVESFQVTASTGSIAPFIDLLTQATRTSLEAALTPNSAGIYDEAAAKLLRDGFHRFKGAARLSGLNLSERAISACDETLGELCSRSLAELTNDLAKKIEQMGQQTLEILWAIGDGLAGGESEPNIVESMDLARKIQLVVDASEMIKFDLSFLSVKG